MGTKLRLEIVIILPTAARGSGGALKLPQRVRAEPGRQTFLMHFWPENEVWELLNSLNRLLTELGANMHFDLNLKSLTMSGFKIPLSFISAHSTHIQSPSSFPAMGTKLRLEFVIILPHCG